MIEKTEYRRLFLEIHVMNKLDCIYVDTHDIARHKKMNDDLEESGNEEEIDSEDSDSDSEDEDE